MKYLPYDEVILKTSMDKAELLEVLSQNTGERQLFFSSFSGHNKLFNGTLYESGFEIRRSIGYSNSFLPEILGRVHVTKVNCSLHLTFKLNTFVLVFMSIWMGVITLVCLGLTLNLLLGGTFNPAFLVVYGMFAFGALLTLLPFKYEVKKAKSVLCRILDAHEVEEVNTVFTSR